jgi:adenosylhomocysteine nucleosidase
LTLKVVGVVCALASEARHLRPSDALRVALSGMGGTAATQSARSLVEAGAQALVSWGMAGGLDPAFAPGTIFLPSEVASSDGAAVIATDQSWRECLGAGIAARQGPAQPRPVLRGRLLTSVKAVGTRTDKAALHRQTGAAAVDMESLAIAEVARSRRLPFLAIRVIVDSAADTLPQAVTAAADSEGHLQVWRLLGALARTPGELPALLRLGQRYRLANRSLAAVARVGLFGGAVGGAVA